MSPQVGALLLAVMLLAVALLVRIWPLLRRPPAGCDAWFYLSYARTLRRDRRFPVVLPNYLLDIPEQWYPPLFPVLLALLPPRLLDRWHWLVAPLIDLAQMTVVLLLTWTTTTSLFALVIAGTAYAVMPTLVHDAQTMTSRPLGSLLSTLVVLSVVAVSGVPGILVSSLIFAVVLLTHKLSTQLLIVVLPVLAVATSDPRYVWVIAVGALVAVVGSRGFYWKVLLGHLDVLRFWQRNHRVYTAHQFDDSPIYGGGRSTAYRYYAEGVRGQVRLVGRLVLHQPFVILLIPAAALLTARDPLSWWALTVAVAAFATTLVPALRFVGEGHKYWKYGAVPLAYLAARLVPTGDPAATVAFAGAFVASIVAIAYVYREPSADRSADAAAQDAVAAFIRASDIDRILCFPLTIADRIAYETSRSVFWGTHSGGHERVAGFYPVLTIPLRDLAATWRPGAVVVDRTYVDPDRLGVPLGAPIFGVGSYSVFRWPGPSNGGGSR